MGFANPGSSRVPWHYKYLVESGIVERLATEFQYQKNYKRKRAGEHKPPKSNFTMDGCISTLFILCAGLVGIGLVIFCCEVVKGKIFFWSMFQKQLDDCIKTSRERDLTT